MLLTPAQRREYALLQQYESVYVYGHRRRNIFNKLVEKNLAETDGSWHWFHLKKQNGKK